MMGQGTLAALLGVLLLGALASALHQDDDQIMSNSMSGSGHPTPIAPLDRQGAASLGTFVGGKLRFRPDGTFRILQLTDLHYGENSELDARSDEVQRRVLAAEQPDLVVFSGDMVSGWFCRLSDPQLPDCGPGWFAAKWGQLTAPVRQAGIPYAITLGNHDAEAELTRREIVTLDITTGGLFSLTRQGPAEATGASNYWLDIFPPLQPGASCQQRGCTAADSEAPGAAQPAARVWLLDSGDHTCPPLMFGWGCVAEDTLAWVNRTAQGLPRVPSLAFVHIPAPQFLDAWYDGPTVGRKEEEVACSVRDTGLFDLAKQVGINAIYSGHDHNCDYAGIKEGVRFAYGRKTGYGSYGPPKGWLRGARVIELRLGQGTGSSKTWIRQEDGSRVVQQPSTQDKSLRQLICHCDEMQAALERHQQLQQTKLETIES